MRNDGQSARGTSVRSLLCLELKRACGRNLWFWLVLAVGVTLALWAAFSGVIEDYETLKLIVANWDKKYFGYGVFSCFANWMPVRSYEAVPGAFFMVWPLLAVLPYAWCLSSDASHGVLAQQCVRASKAKVLTAKVLASATCGSIVICVPLLANLAANACIWPAEKSILIDMMQVGVGTGMPLTGLFYANPLAACVVWTLVCALVAGAWSALACGLSYVARSFLETTVATFLFAQALAYVGQQLYSVIVGVDAQNVAAKNLAYQFYYGFDLMHMLQFNVVRTSTLVIQVVVLVVAALACWGISLRRDVL